jgi:hypothetical protein
MAVRVSGWIYNNPDGVTSGMFYLTDNPLYARPDTLLPMPHDALTIKSSKPFPASVDMTKKCFVSGHINIFQLHTASVLNYGDDKACYVFIPNVIADSIFFAD